VLVTSLLLGHKSSLLLALECVYVLHHRGPPRYSQSLAGSKSLA
jgi:hypothetical protein